MDIVLYNYVSGGYDKIRDDYSDLSKYVPQGAGVSLYNIYVASGEDPLRAVERVIEVLEGKK